MPFNFVSGIIYSATAIAAIALGAFFYRSVQHAQKNLATASAETEAAAPVLPPGAKVITRDGKVAHVPSRGPDPAPAPSPATVKPSSPPQPATVAETPAAATADDRGQPAEAPEIRRATVPDLTPLPAPKWSPSSAPGMIPAVKKLTPVADTLIVANTPGGRDLNGGALGELSMRGNDQFILAQYGIEPVRGWTVVKATWNGWLKSGRLNTLGFSTVPASWQEGDGRLDAPATSGATLGWADFSKSRWRADGAPLTQLIRGNNGSLLCVRTSDGETAEPNNWVKIELDPAIVQSLIAGTAYGIAITDEKGQLASTIAIASRDDGPHAHFIEMEGIMEDVLPPGTIADLEAYAHPALSRAKSAGAVLTWTATGDDSDRGQAFSYEVRYGPAPTPYERSRLLAPHLTPRPQPAGQPDKAIVEGLDPDTLYTFFVRAVDETGQPGAIAQVSIKTHPAVAMPAVPAPEAYAADAIDIAGGVATLRVVEETVGVDPVTGATFSGAGREDDAQPNESFVWDRNSRTLRLRAARNEIVGLQLVLGRKQAEFPALELSAKPFENPKGKLGGGGFRFHRVWYGFGGSGKTRHWIGDALIPFDGKLAIDAPPNKIPNQTVQAVYAELHIPPTAEPGTYIGQLNIGRDNNVRTTLNVILEVLPLNLPEKPSYTIELLAPPNLAMLYKKDVANNDDAGPVEQAYYRLAHEHRCAMAVVPYLPNGSSTHPFTPKTTGRGNELEIASWAGWDGRFQRLLDGSAFLGSPSGASPVPHLILPVFENWPEPFEDGYICLDKETDAEHQRFKVYAGAGAEIAACMSADYWRGVRSALRQFRDHFRAKGWRAPAAHFLLNNNPAPNYAGKPPLWNLGTPIYADDFAALEAYARVAIADLATWPPGGFHVRVSITNSAALAGYGEGLFSLLTVAETDPVTWDALRRRQARTKETLWLETPAAPMERNTVGLSALAIRMFLEGADGWSLQETVGRPDNWVRATPGALVYPGSPLGREEPMPSLRLKALRRIGQDTAYLSMLQAKKGWTREQLGDFVRRQVPNLESAPAALQARDFYALRRAAQDALLAE